MNTEKISTRRAESWNLDPVALVAALQAEGDASFDAAKWGEYGRTAYVLGWVSGELRAALGALPKKYRAALARRLDLKA